MVKSWHKTYYKLSDAQNSDNDGKQPFILANERLTRNGHVGRCYVVFPSFDEFLARRARFPHCHEIIANHCNVGIETCLHGRLVFDFDVVSKKLPPDDVFKSQVEHVVREVIMSDFKSARASKLDFVWSRSLNSKKFSRHLTVKNCYFADWLQMSHIFYVLFRGVWNHHYKWIKAEDLIDSQIIRKNASLRMPGSSKIGGHPLVIDSAHHTLSDALIRDYGSEHDASDEQTLYFHDLVSRVQSDFAPEPDSDSEPESESDTPNYKSKNRKLYTITPYPDGIYRMAFDMLQQIQPRIFSTGEIKGGIMRLDRKRAARCLLSGKLHENDNAYLIIISPDKCETYRVYFGCFRKCLAAKSCVRIGYIRNEESYLEFSSPQQKTHQSCSKM